MSGFASKFHFGGIQSKRVILSYIFDYVVILVLMLGFLAMDFMEPYHQEFSLRNYTLQYKFAVKERIPNIPLVLIAVCFPAVVIVLYTLVIDGLFSRSAGGRRRKYSMKDRLWELNCGLLGLGLSISMSYVFVGTLKNAIGKPRPDLIDRCKPNVTEDPSPLTLSNYTICTQTNNAILKDGFRSFPSGHSSTSFSGLFYLSLYLAAKLHVLDSRGEVWKFFVVLVPSLAASLVAGSRIMDARHHPFDVLSGSAIGILIAWAAYRQYFPEISNFKAKGRAYPMRTWGRDSSLMGLPTSDSSTFPNDFTPLTPSDEERLATQSSGNYFRDEMSRQASKHRPRTADFHATPAFPLSPMGPGGTMRQVRGARDGSSRDDAISEGSEEYEMRERALGTPGLPGPGAPGGQHGGVGYVSPRAMSPVAVGAGQGAVGAFYDAQAAAEEVDEGLRHDTGYRSQTAQFQGGGAGQMGAGMGVGAGRSVPVARVVPPSPVLKAGDE